MSSIAKPEIVHLVVENGDQVLFVNGHPIVASHAAGNAVSQPDVHQAAIRTAALFGCDVQIIRSSELAKPDWTWDMSYAGAGLEMPSEQADSMFHVQRGSKEWDAMWARLALEPVNAGVQDPSCAECDGECWQYMGSSLKHDSGTVVHEFRHRFHPKTRTREYRKIAGTSFTAGAAGQAMAQYLGIEASGAVASGEA